MYSFIITATIDAPVDAVWAVWSDPDRFPRWDPRELRTQLNGPFAIGSTIESKQKGIPGGTATITAVETGRRWTVTCPLPGGRLVIDHLIDLTGDETVTVHKRYDVTGPLVPLFRAYYAPKVLRAMPASFAALGVRASEVGAHRG